MRNARGLIELVALVAQGETSPLITTLFRAASPSPLGLNGGLHEVNMRLRLWLGATSRSASPQF